MLRGATAFFEDRFRNRALLLAVLLALVCGLTFDPKLYVNGDNVDYMLLAQRILHDGTLWASGKFPPVFPMLLAPVQLVAGTACVPQKILVGLLFVATGPLLLVLTERVMPRAFAFPAVALGMISIPVLEFSHYVMSEVPYLFFQTAAFVAGERLLRMDGPAASEATRRGDASGWPEILRTLRSRAFLVFFLFAALAFYTRTIGLVVPGAFLLVCLCERRRRLLAASAAATLVLLAPWLLHTLAAAGGEGESYLAQLVRVNPYYPQDGLLTPAALFDRVTYNASRYFAIEIPRLLVPLTVDTTYVVRPEVHRAWHAHLWLLPVALLLLGLRGRLRALPLTITGLAATLCVCLLWPPIWTSVRFLIPILPLLVLLFLCGCRDAAALAERAFTRAHVGARARAGTRGDGAARPRLRRPPDFALALVLLVLLAAGARNIRAYAADTREYPLDWKYYFETARWARAHLPPDALVIDRKPTMFSFVSGVRAAGFPRAEPDSMIAYLQRVGADYVHLSSIPYDDIPRYLYPAVQQRPSYFLPFWRTERSGGMMSALFAFDPTGSGPGLPPPPAGATLPPLKSRPRAASQSRPPDARSSR